MKKLKIPVVILNWNNFQDTKECIDSLMLSEESVFDVYLIDNNSNAEDKKLLMDHFGQHPHIQLILNKENLGFARAHNEIFKEITSQYPAVFVLNNDTFLPPETHQQIQNHFSEAKEDMLTFKMLSYWNRKIMDNAGHKMLSSGEIIPIGHGEPEEHFSDSFKNMGACAGATIYSSKMLNDIGHFDEYFHTGYEDAELGLRAIIAGYESVYDPELLVYHKMGQSIKKVFNYQYTLKIQTDIFYTYLKLVHWQVLVINFIPFLLRFLLITIIDIVFWRPKYLKIQYHALYNIFFKDFGKVMKARKDSKRLRRISWWNLLRKQEFFLLRDIRNFYKFIIRGEKSYFEK